MIFDAARSGHEESSRALSKLCQTYWLPVYAFIRHRGNAPEEAKDLTQGFFARLLDKKPFATADNSKGKFRTYLLGAVKFYLANEWDKQQTSKRGGSIAHVAIDALEMESAVSAMLADETTPERTYERQWAQAVLSDVTQALRADYARRRKAAHFEEIVPFLLGGADVTYAEMATQIGISESAVKMAVKRMRHRFGDLLRAHISATVASEAEVEEEIRHLMAAFR